MPLASSSQEGQAYVFGFQASDAPSIGTGFVPRSAELRYEPEVYAQAMDGEGHTDSVTLSKADKRKITATFTGYITSSFDITTFPLSFTWQSRKYIIKSISKPLRKGEYAEVSMECESFVNVS
jgi:hypothetical protein